MTPRSVTITFEIMTGMPLSEIKRAVAYYFEKAKPENLTLNVIRPAKKVYRRPFPRGRKSK